MTREQVIDLAVRLTANKDAIYQIGIGRAVLVEGNLITQPLVDAIRRKFQLISSFRGDL